jgi:hypothetical protein
MFSVGIELSPERVELMERRLLAEQKRRVVENALAHYRAYPKQLEFHAAGATHRERLLIKAAKQPLAVSRSPCTPLAVIPTGGRASGSTVR